MKKIDVYTMPNCKACDEVVHILDEEDVPFCLIPYNANRETAELMRANNITSLPAIFIDDQYAGSGLTAVFKINPDIKISQYL